MAWFSAEDYTEDDMEENLPLNPNVEIFQWGPIKLHLFYADCIQGLFLDFPRIYKGYSWSKAVLLWNGDKFVWLHEFDQLRKNGRKLFIDRMLPLDSREQGRQLWQRSVDDLIRMEKEMDLQDFSKSSDEELAKLWEGFESRIEKFWLESVLPELSNYGSTEYLAEKLKGLVPANDIPSVLEVLTAPEEPSFYQEEEIDLAEAKDIEAHQRRYFWLKNGYDHVEVLPVPFFEERKNDIPPNFRAEVNQRFQDILKRKEEVKTQYSLSDELMKIGEAIADGIVWQDKRKKQIWMYLHYRELLLKEVVRRRELPKEKLLSLLAREVIRLLRGKQPDFPIEERETFGLILDDNHPIEIFGKERTLTYWKTYVEIPVDSSKKELKGIIASKGKGIVQGKVRVILNPRSAQLNEGEVLVTTMTTPEFIFAMKKAAAIITDEGGLTSHAAIVSRELNVPCIVGTKIATKLLKDGDLVQVDASKGIVRKI